MVHKLQAGSKGERQNLEKVKSPKSYQGPQGLCSWRALQSPSLIWLISSSLTGSWNKCHISPDIVIRHAHREPKAKSLPAFRWELHKLWINQQNKTKMLSPLLFINDHFRCYVITTTSCLSLQKPGEVVYTMGSIEEKQI